MSVSHWKKGQVSVFIVIGVIVLLVAAIILYSFDQSTKSPTSVDKPVFSNERDAVNIYLLKCFESATKNSILTLGREGFYDSLPPDYEVISSYQFTSVKSGFESKQDIDVVPAYINKGDLLAPDEEHVRQALESRIQKEVNTCIDGFKAFTEQGVVFAEGNISVTVGLDYGITAALASPITVTLEETSFTIDNLQYSLPYLLQEKYSIVRQFLDEQAKDPAYMPIGFLTRLAAQRQFTFETDYVDDGTIVYHFVFNDFADYASEPLVYSFIIRYDWGGVT